MNNKGADQTAWLRRLICAFVVRIWHKQFSHDMADDLIWCKFLKISFQICISSNLNKENMNKRRTEMASFTPSIQILNFFFFNLRMAVNFDNEVTFSSYFSFKKI